MSGWRLLLVELNKQSKEQLEKTWIDTITLRKTVLDWAKNTGYCVADLVSRTAEHGIETIYGRKALEANDEQVG